MQTIIVTGSSGLIGFGKQPNVFCAEGTANRRPSIMICGRSSFFGAEASTQINGVTRFGQKSARNTSITNSTIRDAKIKSTRFFLPNTGARFAPRRAHRGRNHRMIGQHESRRPISLSTPTAPLNLLEGGARKIVRKHRSFFYVHKQSIWRYSQSPAVARNSKRAGKSSPATNSNRGFPENDEHRCDQAFSFWGPRKSRRIFWCRKYGRYFGNAAGRRVFRGGCVLTGPGPMPGPSCTDFFAYLMKCCVIGRPL